jgi:hypothetical protein
MVAGAAERKKSAVAAPNTKVPIKAWFREPNILIWTALIR